MRDLPCHFACGSARGGGRALRAHDHEIHVGRHINDVISRVPMAHEPLNSKSCQCRVGQELLECCRLLRFLGRQHLSRAKHIRPVREGCHTRIDHVQYLERGV